MHHDDYHMMNHIDDISEADIGIRRIGHRYPRRGTATVVAVESECSVHDSGIETFQSEEA